MSTGCEEATAMAPRPDLSRSAPPVAGGAVAAAGVDGDELRRVMRHQASTVSVITAGVPGDPDAQPVGTTVTSLVSLSLDPPLVSFSLALGSSSARAWQHVHRGVIHLLHEGQRELARRFAGNRQERFGPDLAWHWDACAGPILAEALAWMIVTPVTRLRTGDHLLVLALVSQTRTSPGASHFGGYAVSPAESAARLEEGIALIRAAWTGRPATFAGAFHRFEELTLAPLPVQRPHPPIRVAANSPDTMRMAGRMGLPILVASHVNTFSGLRTMLTAYRAAQAEAGVVPSPDDVTVLTPTFTAPTVEQLRRTVTPGIDFVREAMRAKIRTWLAATPTGAGADEARQRLEALAAGLEALSFDTMAADRAIFDTPDALADRVAAVGADLGADRVICWFNMGGRTSHRDVVRAMETFADAAIRVVAPV